MHSPHPKLLATVSLTETRDDAPPPQTEERQVPDAPSPAPSRLARLHDFLFLLLP